MSGSSDQLAEVYKQVQSYFQGHPVITVQATKGDPPDQYTIIYSMTGFQQTPDGDIVESNKHVIELSIPFGFPHFPPSCKPKSEIFHPDFDPAAICLGDVWDQDASIANIILHIGRMINGELFSSKNAFNDEAATWYKNNSSTFPLNDAISWGTEHGSLPKDDRGSIDTLNIDDLSNDFEYLSLDNNEDDTTSQSVFPDTEEKEQEDLYLLQQLKFQKRFHELSKKLRTSSHASDEITELNELATQEIQKCKTLHREGKSFEDSGSAAKALKRFEAVQSTVSDYPSIEVDIKRVRQTLELLSDLDPSQFDGPGSIAETSKTSKKKGQTENEVAEKKQPTVIRRNRDSFFENREKRGTLITGLMVGLGVIALGAIGLYYSHSGSILTQSRQSFQQCKTSLTAGQFETAKKICETSKQLLDNIYIFHLTDAQSLRADIDSVLLSETLRNGIEGKILFDGMYLSKQQVVDLKEIKERVAEADRLFAMGKWEKASHLYTRLKEKSSLVKTFSPALLTSIENNTFFCQFQIAIEAADKFINEEQWHLAIGSLTHSQSLLSGLPEDQRSLYKTKLKNLLSRCTFEITQKQGESAFNQGNWQDAIIAYESCLDIADIDITPARMQEILNTIERSKLYLIIEKGNSAFAKGFWNEAIDAYADASAILVSNQTLLDEAKLDINRKKLGKIMLQASIIRDKQTVKSQLENKELHEAGKLYNQILEAIEGSTYSSEEEFVKARQEIHTTLEDLNQKIYIAEKEAYLHENYQSLFVSNYPAALRENLVQPQISFIKEVSGELLFRMQCTEKRPTSRPLTLVMYYAYDKTSGQWELSNENQPG